MYKQLRQNINASILSNQILNIYYIVAFGNKGIIATIKNWIGF